MNALTITSKGQVTLRKDLLRHLGVEPGQKVSVEKLPDGRIVVRAAQKTGNISDTFGMLRRKNGPRLSIDEINEATAEAWAKEH